jgi:Spy/CpxP family protein refolding chaperone
MNNTKVIICLFALFAFGAASGIGITKTTQPSRAAQRAWSEEAWLERRFAEDVQRLNLTPEQQEALRGQYDELTSDLRVIREDTAKKVRELFAKKGTDVWKTFTPEQREAYRKLNEERRARWKQPTK